MHHHFCLMGELLLPGLSLQWTQLARQRQWLQRQKIFSIGHTAIGTLRSGITTGLIEGSTYSLCSPGMLLALCQKPLGSGLL